MKKLLSLFAVCAAAFVANAQETTTITSSIGAADAAAVVRIAVPFPELTPYQAPAPSPEAGQDRCRRVSASIGSGAPLSDADMRFFNEACIRW